MGILDDLLVKVTDLDTTEDSVIALLTNIKAQLDAAIASNDPAKVQAVADAIDAIKAKAAAAVAANT